MILSLPSLSGSSTIPLDVILPLNNSISVESVFFKSIFPLKCQFNLSKNKKNVFLFFCSKNEKIRKKQIIKISFIIFK